MLANKIPFNNAYRQGFTRVGCWCCPNNSSWSEYLSSIYMPDEFEKFRTLLYSFAKKVGKPDWKTYIDYLLNHKDVYSINSKFSNNEGYAKSIANDSVINK